MLKCNIYIYGCGDYSAGINLGIGIYIELDGSRLCGYYQCATDITVNTAVCMAVAEAFTLAEIQAMKKYSTIIYTTEKAHVIDLESRLNNHGKLFNELNEPALAKQCLHIMQKHPQLITICSLDEAQIGIKVAQKLATIACGNEIHELKKVKRSLLKNIFKDIDLKEMSQ